MSFSTSIENVWVLHLSVETCGINSAQTFTRPYGQVSKMHVTCNCSTLAEFVAAEDPARIACGDGLVADSVLGKEVCDDGNVVSDHVWRIDAHS
jgi:cysteine-rich repeat protein